MDWAPNSLPNADQCFPSTSLLDFTGHITREDDYPFAHGGSADIWKGTLLRDTEHCKVVIKVIRVNNESENCHEKMNKRLDKEILVWHRLDHENVLPLLGITHDFGRGNPVGMVCPWLENGNLNGYLERCQAVLSLRGRFRILCEVAAGLSYLHSNDVVHGDLTGSNILIDSNGKALLADFGLSNVVAEACGPLYVTSSIGGSVRWAAPEHFHILEGDHVSTVTTHGDIYSYGSVTLQVLSGKLPYYHLRRDAEVLIELHHGVHPPRPVELADDHWQLISRCWAEDPMTRPNIDEVSECVWNHYQAPFPAADTQFVPRTSTLTEPMPVGNDTSASLLTLIFTFARRVLLHIILR